ncbi:MAG TPA: hypothetical protein VNL95_09935, partial [Dehalococcoidia bacterium]|nr:hypothetical protein [Dehalococcoidia bacterium]
PRLWACLGLGFLVDWAFALVFLVGLQVQAPAQVAAGPALAGYALAAYGLAKLLAQAGCGPLLEGMGPHWGLRLGLATVLGGMAVLAPAKATGWVLAGAAIYGGGAGLAWPSLYALASAHFPYGERGRLSSGMALSSVAALAAGVGVGLVLPGSLPLAAVVALAASLVALAAVASPTLGTATWRARGLMGAPVSVVVGAALQPSGAAVSLLLLLQTTAAGALVSVFRAWGKELLGTSFHVQALLLAPAAAGGGLGLAWGGPAADRLGRLPVMAMGTALVGVAVLGASLLRLLPVVGLVAAVGGLGLGLATPTFGAVAMDLARWWGSDMLLAWFLAVEGAGHALGPALGGLLESLSGPAPVLRLAAALFLACAGVALLAWRRGWQPLRPALATGGSGG